MRRRASAKGTRASRWRAATSVHRYVIIALTPAALFSVYLFGIKALLLILVSAASAVISEYSYEKLLGKELTVRDLSAIITGILIAFNVPIGFPLWKLIFGNVFAIVIVKQLFGGIGQNFMNPALAARALLVASWPTDMTNFYSDFTTAATPLSGGKEIKALQTGSILRGLLQGLPAANQDLWSS